MPVPDQAFLLIQRQCQVARSATFNPGGSAPKVASRAVVNETKSADSHRAAWYSKGWLLPDVVG